MFMKTTSYENRPSTAVVYPPVPARVATHAVTDKTTCALTTVTTTAPIMSSTKFYSSHGDASTFAKVEASLRHRTYCKEHTGYGYDPTSSAS